MAPHNISKGAHRGGTFIGLRHEEVVKLVACGQQSTAVTFPATSSGKNIL